jgi:hypothetical protein
MPSEITAQAAQFSDAPEESDYQAFCEALSASARGRAFLAEYTRRNRNADTEQLLTAIERLQSLVATHGKPQTSEQVKQQLRALLDEIVAAQCELEARTLATKAEKLAELIALVEKRISNILASLRAEAASKLDVQPPVSDLPDEPIEGAERAHLAVVPSPEQPELPIPSPAASQPPSIALVRGETIMAEVELVQPPPEPIPQRPKNPPMVIDRPQYETASVIEQTPNLEIGPPSNDPLAAIAALSEEERLALFT